MIEPRLILCSGAEVTQDDPIETGRKKIVLTSFGKDANVNICFQNVAKVLQHQISPRLMDLLEVAAYVYATDCATSRGREWSDEKSSEPWGRDFAFVIAVREPEFWASEEICSHLAELLSFLSSDRYSFTFVQLKGDHPGEQQYLEFSDEEWPFHAPGRVIMFSGGLDSLAGAVEMARAGGNLMLVSHRPVSTISSRQQNLFRRLKEEFPDRLIHVPVWINKNEGLGRESTQRTRSFLFTSLGTVVAELVQAGGVRFFENGVVSLNLPVADEVVRARASRTTHPAALIALQALCTKVTGREFVVDNPYLLKTKTEVTASLAANGAAHLIPYTCSCAHSMFKSKSQLHCGTCSQCIDRRFATIAAALTDHDPETDYVTDVFLGARKDGPEKNIAVDYARLGIELNVRSETELAMRFNAELSRAVRYEAKRSEAAQQLIALHKRHGEVVCRVLRDKVSEHAKDLIDGTLEKSSLLALFIGSRLANEQGQAKTTELDRQMHLPGDLAVFTRDVASLKPLLESLLQKFELSKRRTAKKTKLQKRDAVIFSAILLGHRGIRYCTYLHAHEVKPKWYDPESGIESYPKSYQAGDPWRKKVQDEKTRARLRMDAYIESELDAVFRKFMPNELADLRHKLSVRTIPMQKFTVPSRLTGTR